MKKKKGVTLPLLVAPDGRRKEGARQIMEFIAANTRAPQAKQDAPANAMEDMHSFQIEQLRKPGQDKDDSEDIGDSVKQRMAAFRRPSHYGSGLAPFGDDDENEVKPQKKTKETSAAPPKKQVPRHSDPPTILDDDERMLAAKMNFEFEEDTKAVDHDDGSTHELDRLISAME